MFQQVMEYLSSVISKYASSLNSFRILQGDVQIEKKKLVIVFPTGSVTDDIKNVINDIKESYRNINIVIKELY